MSSTSGSPRRSRGRPRKTKLVQSAKIIIPKVALTTRSKASGPASSSAATNGQDVEGSDDDCTKMAGLGDEYGRWRDLMRKQNIKSNEELARMLMDSWEIKHAKKDCSIDVGPATMKDFQAYKHKVKKSPDEIIRYFLRVDADPFQTVMVLTEDVSRGFDAVKSCLKVNSNNTLKHLLNVREKYHKLRGIDKYQSLQEVEVAASSNTNPDTVVPAVRTAVREEIMKLAGQGFFMSPVADNSDGNKTIVVEDVTETSPDSGKKRSRKSHPHRFVLENEAMETDSDLDPHVDTMTTPDNLANGCEEDPTALQYNYVINSAPPTTAVLPTSTVTLPLVGTPQVLTPGVLNNIYLQQAPSQVLQDKDLRQALTLVPISNSSGVPVLNNVLPIKDQTSLPVKGQIIPPKETFNITKDVNGRLNCPYCTYQCMNMTRMRGHCAVHIGKGFRCSYCNKSFNELKKLEYHVKAKHEKNDPLKCSFCSKKFFFKSGLKFHEEMHMRFFKFWCEPCALGFHSVPQFEDHVTNHPGPCPFVCHLCRKKFHHLQPFIIHRRYCTESSTTKLLSCDMCRNLFDSTEDLESHMMSSHPDLTSFRCDCGEEFKHLKEFDDHKKSCTTEQLLNMIKRETGTFKTESDGLSDIEIIKVESLHDDVNAQNEFAEDVNKGTNVDFDEDSNDSIQITNVESGEQFSCDLTGEINTNGTSSSGLHSCQYCNYKTSKLSHMKRHVLTHSARKYKCFRCPKIFNDRTKRRSHENAKHQGQARYKCDDCSRTFSSKGGITYHQQTKHNNSYKYKCETCDKGFNTWQHYLGHKNTHTGIRPFVCEKCNIGFSYPSVLTSHKRVCKGRVEGMDMNGLDLYPCKECSQKFALPSALQQHVQDYHRESITEKYICECGEQFELKALHDLHKQSCVQTDKSSAMIIQAISDEAAGSNGAEFQQLSQEKFNSIVSNQPVFPT